MTANGQSARRPQISLKEVKFGSKIRLLSFPTNGKDFTVNKDNKQWQSWVKFSNRKCCKMCYSKAGKRYQWTRFAVTVRLIKLKLQFNYLRVCLYILLIRNRMVSSEIWVKQALMSFSKTSKTHSCMFYPNCTRNNPIGLLAILLY